MLVQCFVLLLLSFTGFQPIGGGSACCWIALPKCILGGAVFGASGCGRFVVVVVVEGDDGGVVVVAMLVTAFVGVPIIIVWECSSLVYAMWW